jgi:dUTP pyrophosphatase
MKIRYQKLHPAAMEPLRMSPDAAGYDLFACLEEPLGLKPGKRIAVPTGIATAIPSGYEAQIRPRSGIALKLGLGVLNSPGTIDADYRGEIKVILINLGEEEIIIQPRMRIPQMIITQVQSPQFELCESLIPP